MKSILEIKGVKRINKKSLKNISGGTTFPEECTFIGWETFHGSYLGYCCPNGCSDISYVPAVL